MKTIDIIILHYGDVEVTRKCIKTIESIARSFRSIILVNNDPEIDLKNTFKETPKRIVINAKKNLGFAAGVNVGIKKALKNKADYVCLVNNDVTVEMNFIKPIADFMDNKKDAGIVGSVIRFSINDIILYDHGAAIDKLTGIGKHKNESKISFKTPQKVDYVSGCCMMIKREVFENIGLFDEQFFMYYEDIDFCLRAKEGGFTVYTNPIAIINHELSKSIGKKSGQHTYQLVKSNMRFSKKHKEFPFRYIGVFEQIIKFSLKMPDHIPSIWRGIKEA